MTITRVNNLSCTISNTPGLSGDLVISAARTGYVRFGAAQDGLTFNVTNSASSAPTADKEVRTGCVYTHSTQTLTRGTLESSTTGVALTLTSAAVVTNVIAATELSQDYYPTVSQSGASGIDAAYDAAHAAGGGLIVLPNADITLTSALRWASNIEYRGTPVVLDYQGQASTDDGMILPLGGTGNGTLLRGDGTFNGIEFHPNDASQPFGTVALAVADCGSNGTLENIAFVNMKSGVKMGARFRGGLNYSAFRRLYAFTCTDAGFWFENYLHCTWIDTFAYNCQGGIMRRLSASFGGDNSLAINDGVFTGRTADDSVARKQRGIRSRVAYGAGAGGPTTIRQQCNRFNTNLYTTASNVSVANGSANITLNNAGDGAKLAVEMPVFFSATQSGFTVKQMYFVRSIIGDVITVNNYIGGLAVVASGNTTPGTLSTQGFPAAEFVAEQQEFSAAAQLIAGAKLVFTEAHSYLTGQPVVTPADVKSLVGISVNTTYYAIVVDATGIKFATTAVNALAGTAVALSGTSSGAITIFNGSNHHGPVSVSSDFEAGGTCLATFHFCNLVNFFQSALNAGGFSGGVYPISYVLRNSTGQFNADGGYTTDIDLVSSNAQFFGTRNMAAGSSLGYNGLGTWRDQSRFSNPQSNLEPGFTVDDGPVFERLSYFTRLNTMVGLGLGQSYPGAINYGTGRSGIALLQAGAYTLPLITASLGGAFVILNNVSGGVVTVTADASQKFNQALFTTLTMAAKSSATVMAHWDGGLSQNYSWVIVGNTAGAVFS